MSDEAQNEEAGTGCEASEYSALLTGRSELRTYDHDFVECPECGKDHSFDSEDLPDRACDTVEFECDYCHIKLRLGWYAMAELTKAS